MAFEVSTPVYDGPFDLLLHLILREEVELYDVPLAGIVDAYVAEMDRMQACDLDVATEFLLIAATLVELKARRLLPGETSIDLDEELALLEERDLLLARLVECKLFKDAAVAFRRLGDEADRSVARRVGLPEPFAALAPDLLAGVSPDDLCAAFERAVAPKPQPRIDLDHVAPIRASVTDAVEDLVARLPARGATTFRALVAGVHERLDVIIQFLAILELFKQGLVDLAQSGTFGDIRVAWTGGDDRPADLTSIDAYDG